MCPSDPNVRTARAPRPARSGGDQPGGTRGRLDGLRRYWERLTSLQRNARLYLAGAFLMGLGHGAVWVHMNLYFRSLGFGEEFIGRILAVRALGTVIMAIPAALWIDRVSAQVVFGVSAIGFVAAFAATLLFTSPAVIMGASFVFGMLFTVHMVAAAPFFMRNAAREDRIYLFGFANAVQTLAVVVASVGVGWTALLLRQISGSEVVGLRVSLLGVAFVTAFAAAFFLRIKSPAPLEARRTIRDYVVARDWRLLFRLTLPAFIVGMGAGLIIPFLNLYFRDRFGQDPGRIGWFFAVSQFLTMVGFLAGAPMARRIGSVRSIVLTEALSIPFFLMLAITQNLALAVLAFWIRGALMNMSHPISTNFAMEMVDPAEHTVTNSLRALAWNASWMFSAQLGGWMIERGGYNPPMFAAMAMYAFSSVLFYRFFRGHLDSGRAQA